MKKLILTSLTAVALLAAATSSRAQGTVNFANSFGGPCIVSNSVTHTTANITAGNFVFGLYAASTTNALLAQVASGTPVITITNSGFAGTISGTVFTTTLGAVQPYVFQVAGWSIGAFTAGATDYQKALVSGAPGTAVGISGIGTFTTGFGGQGPTSLFSSTIPGAVLTPTLITPVPEPSTMVLGGLGVAALAFFRRRK